jgi:hypothetical protein
MAIRLLPLLTSAFVALLPAEPLQELKQVRSSEALARFIERMVHQPAEDAALLAGLDSPEELRIPGCTKGIPVRDVMGTIVAERFPGPPGEGCFPINQTQSVREIHAYRDVRDEVVRYPILAHAPHQIACLKKLLAARR